MTNRNLFSRTLLALTSSALLGGVASAGPIISQAGNGLGNGSFEAGTTNQVTGSGGINSAASLWRQWENGGNGSPSSQLITEAQMQNEFGVDLVDGNHAVRVNTLGNWDGLFTFDYYGHPGWDLNDSVTFSGWVYVISGSMQFAVGSNQTGFTSTQVDASSSWQFISVTSSAGLLNDEPLLYSLNGPSQFIVDSVWLNNGTSSMHPTQTLGTTDVPEPHMLLLSGIGLLLLATRRRRRLLSFPA